MIPAALTIESSGHEYILTGDSTYHLNCDGKKYPASHSGMLRCELSGQKLVFERTIQGKLERAWAFSLSSDGLNLTENITAYFEGVPPSTDSNLYRRSSNPQHSLDGVWTGVKTIEEGGDAVELRVHDGFFYFRDARDGNITDAKLDGTPSPFLSPGVPAGITWANVLESERRIVGHPLRDGKPYGTELLELAPDGKFLKISHGDETGTYEIFEKK